MIDKLRRLPFKPGRLLLLAVVVVALGLWGFSDDSEEAGTYFVAREGSLTISVREGGSIEALESQVIRSEVRSREGTKILRLVEEGYQVTDEDVANRLILVELDTSYLDERMTSQEIEFQNTLVNLTEAVKEKEIQENRNLSTIKTASLQTKFALMDFQKYLGEKAARDVLEKIDLNEASIKQLIDNSHNRADHEFTLESSGMSSAATLDMTRNIAQDALPPTPVDPTEIINLDTSENLLPEIRDYNIDFGIYANDENESLLGDGEARQELRRLKDAVLIAEAEFALSKKTYEGGVKLSKEGFMTPNELQQKKIAYEKSQNALETAKANLELFKAYDLQKNAEQFLLDYERALLELSRVKKDAIAEMSDRIADVNWAKRRYRLEKSDLDELKEQIQKCVIRAERPGLVVYGDGDEEWDQNEMIREGATVRTRQAIITIPDMRNMGITVKIHESHVKRVKEGQMVRITVDAEDRHALMGKVSKVGILPDSEDRRFNPDQKVYRTTIAIDGTHDWIKPGMTAQAEILIREIPQTIYVPLQAIVPHRDRHICFVRQGSDYEIRSVEVEDYNSRFAAIQSGLKAGEQVYLQAPADLSLENDYFIPEKTTSEDHADQSEFTQKKSSRT